MSYADFITLLFAFFVVLYATSQADVKKQGEFEESFKKEMKTYGGGGSGNGEGEGEAFSRKNVLGSSVDEFPPRGAGPAEVQDHVERQIQKDLSQKDQKELIGGIRHDTVGVRVQLATNKLFNPGSAELAPESAAALEELGRLLKNSNRKLIVEGHTDDEPIHTERYPSNWELSAARATKIVRYLAARHKIPASRMTAVAYADQRPVVANDSEENRARNRRIEILIVTDDQNPAL